MVSGRETTKDQTGILNITGRYQQILRRPVSGIARPTLAAGAVVYRETATGVEFAVIHRPHYNDWSLPKGKTDSGENLLQTAGREIWEETGFQVTLGKLLGRVMYPVGNHTKVVYYWLAKATTSNFVQNNEVNELRWVDASTAKQLLTYDIDKHLIDKALKRLRPGAQVTSRLILVRHAHAGERQLDSDDYKRDLSVKGIDQAAALAETLPLFSPTNIFAATPTRCQNTGMPTARKLGLPLKVDAMLGDEAWITRMKDAKAAFTEIINQENTTNIVVSQGVTIPDVVAWCSAAGTLPLSLLACKKASIWALDFHDGLLVGADYYESPLPVKKK